MVEEWSSKFVDKEFMSYVNEALKNMDYVEGVDYGQVLKIRKQKMNRFKDNSGFGSGTNWFGK
jgi:hypothetical protein